MENNTDVWIFPKNIEFWLMPEYLKKIELISFSNRIIFDLRETENVHSSFIGFMIFVKKKTEDNGGELVLKISPSLRKLLVMMNILDYFSISFPGKKISKIA